MLIPVQFNQNYRIRATTDTVDQSNRTWHFTNAEQ